MSRAEEMALKAYPSKKIMGVSGDLNYETRKGFIKGYEQAISDITMLVLGDKMKQGVDIDKFFDAVKQVDLSGMTNAINENFKEFLKD